MTENKQQEEIEKSVGGAKKQILSTKIKEEVFFNDNRFSFHGWILMYGIKLGVLYWIRMIVQKTIVRRWRFITAQNDRK